MSKKEEVFDYIESNKDKIIKFLIEMVSKPSINEGDGGDGSAVQSWLANNLNDFGFDKVDKFTADSKENHSNVCALNIGKGGGKSLLFNGHMDVVPVAKPDIWCCDPFKPIIKDGKIFGRGTSDMKGGVTSAIWAMKAIKDCNVRLKGDVILQSVMGEESQMAEKIGTVQCIKRGYKADFAIVCEPSDMELQIMGPALVLIELIIEGKGAHTSARNQVIFPQPYGVPSGLDVGVDAFKKSLQFVKYFYDLEEQFNHRYRDPILGSGGIYGRDKQGIGIFTINPSLIEGGVYLGTVPSRVKYTYNIWYPDHLISRDELFNEIRHAVKAIASTDDWLKKNPPVLNMPVIADWPGFKTSLDNPGVATLRKSFLDAIGEPAVVSGFKAVCDATYLNKYNVPSVVFGPGSVSWSVHGDNEYTTISNIIDATKVYASMIIDWCNQ
jgi:acetylornithine deacetylase/succinyl-diaminopimelate desuccinylase family protein